MNKFIISPNPHVHSSVRTATIMRDVIIALLPATLVSIVFYGLPALLTTLVSVASCVLVEWALTKWVLKAPSTIGDCSAVVTGLLLAMNLPANIPLWIVVIGAVFAIGVIKITFGGLGQNIFNPAIAARVFLLISFPSQMTTWVVPTGLWGADATTGATLLGKASMSGVGGVADVDMLQTFFVNIGGSAGEISALALLAGFVYLLVRKVVKPWITLSIFASVAIISGIYSAIDPLTYTGPLFNLLTGGLILGACFMATDYVTSPMTTLGGIVYGVLIGLMVMMIRYYGSYPEGVSFAIMFMNMVVPLLDRCFHQKKYGRK